MICKVCGAQIPDNSEACEFCGAKTNDDLNDENISAQNTDENGFFDDGAEEKQKEVNEEIFDDNERRRRKQMQRMLEDRKQQLSEIEQRRIEKRQKQRRNRALLVGAICALVVAGAGVGAYHVAQNIGTGDMINVTPVPTIAAVIPTAAPVTQPTPGMTPEIYTSPAPNNASANGSSSGSGAGSTGSSSGTSSASGSSGSSSGTSSSSGSSGSSSGTSSSSGSGGSSSGTSSKSGSSSKSSSSGGGSTGQASQAAVSDSGSSSANISSQLATGGEVIYNQSTGKYLMTFTVGNTRYYANVSEGSTTDQIKNKPYTITAKPTGESYGGNTIYEISSLTNYEGDYIIADSGTRLLTNSDINGLSKYDLALARNEIYASHGRKFQTAEYSAYFSSKSWYKINPNYNYSDDNSNLNETEIKNVDFILAAERR